MKVILDDSHVNDDLYPFTLSRSAADIRCGILTFRERWELITGNKVFTATETGMEKQDKSSRIIPATFLPAGSWLRQFKKGKINDLPEDADIIRYPFHIFQKNDIAVRLDYGLLTKKRRSKKISRSNRVTGVDIFVENGAIVENSTINTSTGPVYIGKNARIMDGCLIQGPFAAGESSVIKMGSKIYGATTIGPHCIAGGEIKNSILSGYSNKSHDGYLGDSVIGEWCNLGAGTSNSNIKNTAGNIRLHNENNNDDIDAGLKCGLLMGDYSRSAINTSFNTGTVVGAACNIFCAGFPPTSIKSFTWGENKYELEKAFEHIHNWKKLKGRSLSDAEKKILTNLYNKLNDHA